MTPTDELHLFCYWQQLGNKWVEIARFMGRSENWVKNNWKKVLKREGLSPNENIMDRMPELIEKLTVNAANYKQNDFSEPLPSESKTLMELKSCLIDPEESKNMRQSERMELMNSNAEENKMSMDMEMSNSKEEDNDFSEGYDFAQDTNEGNAKSQNMELDLQRYALRKKTKKPF